MTINGKVHCFFEQSGTFKREFIKLGISAEDYDIQNNFGETDHQVDLFKAIEDAYDGRPSLFDGIGKDDLVMAFFPCIYFCNVAEFNQHGEAEWTRGWSKEKLWQWKLEYSRKRQHFYELALKMTAIIEIRDRRMIVENPWNVTNYTNFFWFNRPAFIDKDRSLRGDKFKKPTAYWYINCTHTHGTSFNPVPKDQLMHVGAGAPTELRHRYGASIAKDSGKSGICSEERSMISPTYAHNFICDFILGRDSDTGVTQGDLFNN